MRKAIRTIVATAATTTLAVAALVPAAHAADSTGVEAVADFVSDVAPITLDTQVPEETRTAFVVGESMPEATVTIPRDANTALEISEGSPSSDITLSLPHEIDVDEGLLTQDGTVVFPDAGAGVDVTAQATDGSVRITTVIEDADAPHSFTYDLGLPAGATVVFKHGGLQLLDSDGEWLGGVAPPWAVDANGIEQPTHYELLEGSFVQVVEPRSDAAYPIAADPWLGKDLISKTSWSYKSAYKGYTLAVYPTKWGRAGAYLTVGAATYWWLRDSVWTETKSKTAGTRENTNSMRDQLYCHVDVVRLVDPAKESWNIDTWRPHVSYTKMIEKRCNP